MVYNSYTILRDFFDMEALRMTPLKDLIAQVNYYTPKLKEIARQQESDRLKAELAGKQNMVRPGTTSRRDQ